ncbi:chemotaxis protein CheD [Dissulfurirhabdus thermomarina]|uniref:Probable chemoreceptor glutamine deamidase CheD n=1 Tax=Dissulfurirhabdus thermomarina TaxID=1765737 RepID=A0A6N9TPH1_DISTH|nr:chemotaxis protein CheD [Dissulfurirhabdus thermomarina]NDY43172.1 chemotaxis protein CheD [Dissulfurirhabdus thermomarina]NMX22796.1 chemotaxis protein CheD [Dissulfurirhabdus thermomarina]
MRIVVDIADMRLSQDPGATLVTYSLGSCIAVAIHDPVARVGGLLHYMLPSSKLNWERAQENPCMFADTGIPLLFRKAYAMGAKKENIVVKVAGGGNIMDTEDFFAIGSRNYLVLEKIFRQNGITIAAEHVGGRFNRTVYLHVGTGRLVVKISGGKEIEL